MISNQPLSQPTEQLSTLGEQDFDYTILSPKTRTLVQQHTDEIKSLMRRTAQDIINIGQKLMEVKEQLGHGQFRNWLKVEFDWSVRTAARLMQVATKFKSANLAHLNIAASALYLLAEPSTPNEAQKEALELAKQGENITYAKAKDIINQHKEAAKLMASKPDIAIIPAETVGWEASPAAIQLPVAQTVVEPSEDKLPGKITETPARLQMSNRSRDMAPAADSGDYLPKDQAEVEIQSPWGVDYHLCITKRGQQDHIWLGEVAEVKEATATDIEVVIRISLQPPTI